MSQIEALRIYASLGAGVTVGVTGMYFMFKLQTHNADIMERLLGAAIVQLTEAVQSLDRGITKLCEKLNHEE